MLGVYKRTGIFQYTVMLDIGHRNTEFSAQKFEIDVIVFEPSRGILQDFMGIIESLEGFGSVFVRVFVL